MLALRTNALGGRVCHNALNSCFIEIIIMLPWQPLLSIFPPLYHAINRYLCRFHLKWYCCVVPDIFCLICYTYECVIWYTWKYLGVPFKCYGKTIVPCYFPVMSKNMDFYFFWTCTMVYLEIPMNATWILWCKSKYHSICLKSCFLKMYLGILGRTLECHVNTTV